MKFTEIKTVARPEIWLSEKYNIHRNFRMVERHRQDGIQEHQKGVTKVEDGYVYRETFVQLSNVEDRGDFWYVGFRPVGRDVGRCGFGYTRIYKEGIPEYGTIELEDISKTVNIQTGERK